MEATWTYDLTHLPPNAELRGVTASLVEAQGRTALRVALAAEVRAGTYGVDYIDEPTFVLLPVSFRDGVIEVDLLARLLDDAPDYARAFIGVAYRVRSSDRSKPQYESVYVRPFNGRSLAPPPPRDERAVQYYAYPEWKFDRLRDEMPDGGWEVGADIAPATWTRLRLEIAGRGLVVEIDGTEVLRLEETLAEPAVGAIGLWVDIGTEGFFSNLRVLAG